MIEPIPTPTFGISVIIPTLGRSGLEDTIRSILNQGMNTKDEIIIVRDAHSDPADSGKVRDRVMALGDSIRYYELDAKGQLYGGVPQFNFGVDQVSTENVIMGLGDDDILVDEAFNKLRPLLNSDMYRPILCQVLVPWREVLPIQRRIERHRINGSGFVHHKEFTVHTPLHGRPDADFDWMMEILVRCPSPPAWIDEVLVITKPEIRNGKIASKGITNCVGCGQVRFKEDVDDECRCGNCHKAR